LNPDQYCQDKAAASGSSFYYSFLFLPPEKRRAITAFYAYCREVDDVTDECRDPVMAHQKLAWWRSEIEALYAGRPTHPVMQALQPAARYLPQEYLEEILDGMEMDTGRVRYDDFKSLRLYCHRVAGVVGMAAAEIFGYRNRHTLKYAAELGLALQLTNIIRDVGEDARRDRIYIPREELVRFGVREADIVRGKATTAFSDLMQFQYQRAIEAYHQALNLLPREDRRAQRPGLIMAAIYRATLEEIRRDEYRVLDRRISLTPLRKFWLAWRTWVAS
jgi:15-cis-phytoene synthase